MKKGDGHFEEARAWHRSLRLVPRSTGSSTADERELFFSDIDGHLSGSYLKSEVQACGIRLYILYREIEQSRSREGCLGSFAELVGSTERWVFNWMKGTAGIKQYSVDLLHGWSGIFSRHWEPDGIRLYLLCHPTGVIEPIVDVEGE